jgi:DNA-binding beta-propeller fold protein YncE
MRGLGSTRQPYLARGETPRHVMAPVTIEKELSMRSIKWFGLILILALLLLCGCGGGPSAVITPPPPSALSYTTATAVYIKGTAITPNSPTSTGGAVTSYSVSPALPAGLSLSTSTGIITGTPMAVTATASYTVTASNSAGSTTATLTVTVEDAAPAGLAYTTGTAVYTVGTAITPNSPTSSGGAVTAYSVSQDLPAGLSLDDDTGIISGTPTAVTATASYTVTASNATGSTTATLTITVNAAAAGVQFIPNMNQWITPLAPQGSQFQPLVTPWLVNGNPWLAGQAVSSVVSPDGKTLLVLTSGFNRIFNGDALTDMAFVAGGNVQPANPAAPPAPGGLAANSPSSEYVFIYDISTDTPVQKQVVMIPNSYNGIAFDPKQDAFYVSSGMGDFPFGSNGNPDPNSPQFDNVHVFTLSGATWAPAPSTLLPGPELLLNHTTGGVGLPVPASAPLLQINSVVYVSPCAAGVAVSNDGQTMVVANYYNDSITVFTGGLGNWAPLSTLTAEEPLGLQNTGELDLRPGRAASSPQPGTPGGEYPFWVVIAQPPLPARSTTTTWAYVSSLRDREIDVVNLDGGTPAVIKRIPVKGQPNKMTLNTAQTRLYVAEDESDTVDVIDTNPNDSTWNTVLETIPVIAPPSVVPANLKNYTGANTNSVTLTPDGTQLYVTNGNMNSIAVVALTGTDKNDQVVGLIPTGWYPSSVSFSPDGKWAYVVNGKSPTGPDPNWCYNAGPPTYPNCIPMNEWNPQLTKAGLQSFPTATLAAQLPALTAQVATNNRFFTAESSSDAAVMAAVRQGVQHVIFIIKENRTYDQVLGDLPVGNGDPSLVQWGSAITPNLHNLAQTFVTLDNIMATAEVSYDGWLWTTSGRAPDVVERQYPVAYAARGLSLDSQGTNRSVNVAIPTVAQRMAAEPLTPNDPDLLAGQTDVDAPDGPNDEVNTGYLWDAALRAGLTVRNYGFLLDATCYNAPTCAIPLAHDPAATSTIVASPANVSLTPYTDPFFRGFDNNFPDYYRYTEWEREFNANYAKGGLPSLSLVYFMHDHTGNFGTAIDLVNTPETQEADNDYAVGLLVQKIANSIYANNTLIFVIEDDAQDGADHVDSHRTIAFVAGAYVKQHALVSTQYNTLDFVRTIEEVLGLPQMNLNDALARPMADIFNTTPTAWSFTATPSTYLYNTSLPLPPQAAGVILVKSTHNAQYWARVTKGMDFSDADRVDPAVYNRILWKGMMGGRPYPAGPTGLDLRQNRKELLASYRRSLKQGAAQKPKTVTN